LPGCQCFQAMEQWKCDHLGLCHFAPQRPGAYTPMALPPGYGAPPTTGLAPTGYPPTVVYPQTTAGTTVPPSGTFTGAPYVAPPSNPTTVYPYASPSMGASSNCRECQK
jgi:hypothetical protein